MVIDGLMRAKRDLVRRGLGKVAGGDMVPDLVPFGRRQYPPQGLVHQHEAVEICD
jgi:hypothetical protein